MSAVVQQSRIARLPVLVPDGVEVRIEASHLHVKGAMGELSLAIAEGVSVELVDQKLCFAAIVSGTEARAFSGTMRSLAQNMIIGVSVGYERRLELVGIGYRVAVSGRKINLTLGFSHPVAYTLPEGVEARAESQTSLVLAGADKQQLGQVAANIRAFRPPEPYKGKGVRYGGEQVKRKEAKKK